MFEAIEKALAKVKAALDAVRNSKKTPEQIEKAKELYDSLDPSDRTLLEYIFPEVVESEDERIRKKLVEYISDWKEGQMRWNSNKEFCSRALAYLERQKEPLTPEEKMNHPLYLEGFDVGKRVGETLKEQKPAESDAIKGGDFISDGKRVFLVLANMKERNLGETGSAYCESLILGVDGVVYCDGDDFKKYKRATSDERAKFVHDLKVGVKLKEQSAEWSEEDEQYLLVCKNALNKYQRSDHWDANIISKWLEEKIKSLRPHWKPSEEQMEALDFVLEYHVFASAKNKEYIKSLYNDLKKL